MYKILTIEDKIRVSPAKFDLNLEDAIKNSLEAKLVGLVERGVGIILAVVSIEKVGEGKILPGDGSIHYPVDFTILVYQPEQHEIVKGNVIDVTEFGVFVRMGPLDGMIHVSQIMDDFVSYDDKKSVFFGRDTNRVMKENDLVMARIISISVENNQYKIGLTTRQQSLGVLSWPKIVPVRKPKIAEKPERRGKKKR
ncbi:MAG: DNA-directed RNA polymerase [Candidatus Aenigmatarchaeota archaeon]